MQRITILTTHPSCADFEPFCHGEVTFAFEPLGAAGPRRLIDGSVWAFIDWIIPELSGLEMCRRLRADERTAGAHITMVLERDDLDDRRRAIRAGADDYMIGPASRQSILDRIMVLHSERIPRDALRAIELGALRLDLGAVQARWQRRLIPVSEKGFRLLRYLVENPNRVISRSEIIEALGKGGDPEYLRTVDVWIKRLRNGLRQAGAGHILRTVKGKGYVLDEP
jgi:two-component system, OmpR family, phosphate regulon response regulator PhoB